jgi:hypothetical protein
VPSARVKAVDDDNWYKNDVPSTRQLNDRGRKPEIAGGGPLKKVQSGEASSFFCLDRMRAHASSKGGGGAGVDTVNKDDSYDNKEDNVTSNGHQKTGRGPNNLAYWAGNGRLETRPPKAPTRSGHGATIGTGDDDVSSGGVLPSASDDKFASKERGHGSGNNEAAGAAVFMMRRVVALAGGGTAAGTRCSADGAFILAFLGYNNQQCGFSLREPTGWLGETPLER